MKYDNSFERTRKRNEEIQNFDGFEIPKINVRNPKVLDESGIDRLIIILYSFSSIKWFGNFTEKLDFFYN